nr:hypothetical protein CFP56_67825 [Quercus suber]
MLLWKRVLRWHRYNQGVSRQWLGGGEARAYMLLGRQKCRPSGTGTRGWLSLQVAAAPYRQQRRYGVAATGEIGPDSSF